MALTFSPRNTARIIRLFAIINTPRFVGLSALGALALALLCLWYGLEWAALGTGLSAAVDGVRWYVLRRQRRTSRKTSL